MLGARAEKVKTAFNREVLEEKEHVDLLATCNTLSKVLGNLVEHPNEPKFRRVPCSSKLFADTVVGAKGGITFIVACGFLKKQIDGKDFWTIEPTPEIQEALQVGLDLVNQRIGKVQKKTEQELAALAQKAREEEGRKQRVENEFKEARKEFEERLEMVGGTQSSVAQKFRTPEEMAAKQGRAPGRPGFEDGPVAALPAGEEPSDDE